MIAIYDPLTGVYEIVNSTNDVDMMGKLVVATPLNFDPVNVSHRLIDGVWVENNDPVPLDPSRLKPIQIPFHSDAGATITLPSVPAAARFFTNNSRCIEMMDLTLFTQARLTVRVLTAGTANARLVARWSPSFTTTINNFSLLGVTEVAAPLSTIGVANSGWINLNPDALVDDAYLTLLEMGGTGSTPNPQIGRVSLWLR